MENILAVKAFIQDDSARLADEVNPPVWDDNGERQLCEPNRFVIKDTLTNEEYPIVRFVDPLNGTPDFFGLYGRSQFNSPPSTSVRIDF